MRGCIFLLFLSVFFLLHFSNKWLASKFIIFIKSNRGAICNDDKSIQCVWSSSNLMLTTQWNVYFYLNIQMRFCFEIITGANNSVRPHVSVYSGVQKSENKLKEITFQMMINILNDQYQDSALLLGQIWAICNTDHIDKRWSIPSSLRQMKSSCLGFELTGIIRFYTNTTESMLAQVHLADILVNISKVLFFTHVIAEHFNIRPVYIRSIQKSLFLWLFCYINT